MQAFRQTILDYDHKGHMNLISQNIEVLGVPGFDVITYADWYSQCEYEFAEKLITDVQYRNVVVLDANAEQIRFKTVEQIYDADNTVAAHGVEVTLGLEADGYWRVTQERLMADAER